MADKIREYTVILHQAEDIGGYWAEVPSLPGCVSQGRNKDQALKNIKEAIDLHIEGMKEDDEDIPQEESYKVAVGSG